MCRSLITVICGILLFSAAVAKATEPLPFSAEVNANNINVRSDSTAGSAILCTLDKGERLEVVLELYEWYKIRLPKKVALYIKKAFTECINYKPEGKVCINAKVVKEKVNIRLKPSESSLILGVADKDEIVFILWEQNGWYKIEPAHNSFGWIHKKFLDKVPDKNLKH